MNTKLNSFLKKEIALHKNDKPKQANLVFHSYVKQSLFKKMLKFLLYIPVFLIVCLLGAPWIFAPLFEEAIRDIQTSSIENTLIPQSTIRYKTVDATVIMKSIQLDTTNLTNHQSNKVYSIKIKYKDNQKSLNVEQALYDLISTGENINVQVGWDRLGSMYWKNLSKI